ncbi:conserved hypothetical protein [Shewanella sediminis HAW-EB3]|uniref:Uncharacterized protein n=1 Tax=Shewanella sediminis (strain HAW-EB3) TaxID=425104 RepID=A8FSY0_SHESH|nr:hypothetical protein [Shewanella sediminis]ABV35953.1 conserved hypothetical protein [Shewanella sediminis HAW-EB3]
MQINSTSQNTGPATQAIASKQSVQNATQSKTDSPLTTTQPSQQSNSDSVTISIQAAALSSQSQAQPSAKDAETLPVKPALPNDGEKVDNYVEYKKAKAQYQIYSDMAGIVTGNSQGMSASTAYYLSNNDDARAAVVDSKAQQQQISTMQTYVNTTQSIDDWY